MPSSPVSELRPPKGRVLHDIPTSMDPFVRDIWVEALRSGAYPQGRYKLRSAEDHFCPLGVLADIATTMDVTFWERLDGQWVLPPWIEGSTLSYPVQEWAGFKGMHSSELVPLEHGGNRQPIWYLSDHWGLSFIALADMIEEQY